MDGRHSGSWPRTLTRRSAAPRLRRRRRHDRLQPDPCHATPAGSVASSAWRSAITCCSAATTSISRSPRSSSAARRGRARRRRLTLTQRQSLRRLCSAAKERLLAKRRTGPRADHGPRRRPLARRRLDDGRSDARRGRSGAERIPAARGARRAPRASVAAPACASSGCRTKPIRRSRAIWPRFCRARRGAPATSPRQRPCGHDPSGCGAVQRRLLHPAGRTRAGVWTRWQRGSARGPRCSRTKRRRRRSRSARRSTRAPPRPRRLRAAPDSRRAARGRTTSAVSPRGAGHARRLCA